MREKLREVNDRAFLWGDKLWLIKDEGMNFSIKLTRKQEQRLKAEANNS